MQRHLLYKEFLQHTLLWRNMSSEQPTKVVMSGGKHFVQILYFLHQIVGGGPRQMEVYSNHIGLHFKRRPRHAMNSYPVAARKDARPIASAKKLDTNVLLFVNVKENVQLIENMNCCLFFCKFTPIIKLK